MKKVFSWTGKSQTWDWDNCTLSWVRKKGEDKIRVIVRSGKLVDSDYRNKKVMIKYMIGFDIDPARIKKPEEEEYLEPLDNVRQEYGKPRARWIVRLDDKHSIWQWKDAEGRVKDIWSSTVAGIYKNLVDGKTPDISLTSFQEAVRNYFHVLANDDNEIGRKIVPVVYQPAIDTWKNFVREIHCHVREYDDSNNPKRIEVTLMFNNEQLREHAVANQVYEWFRSWRYGRTIDVETFCIDANMGVPLTLDFPNIYSGSDSIQNDSTHIVKFGVSIKYYFGNDRHPIIFINTSNHALAESDTNHDLWKWEYVGWLDEAPIDFGEKSRQEIDMQFRAKYHILLDLLSFRNPWKKTEICSSQ